MLRRDSIFGIVSLRGMAYDTSEPYMRESHLAYMLQRLCIKVLEFTRTILLYRTVFLTVSITVAIETG